MTTTADMRPNPFNADLAHRTLAAIENDPDHWDQAHWISGCGTKFCFAGWALRIHTDTTPDTNTAIKHQAEIALGIDSWTASALFSGSNSLQDLRDIVAAFAGADSLDSLEEAAASWGAGDYDDEDYEQEPDQDYWDEDDL